MQGRGPRSLRRSGLRPDPRLLRSRTPRRLRTPQSPTPVIRRLGSEAARWYKKWSGTDGQKRAEARFVRQALSGAS